MNPDAILATIRAACEFGTEFLKWLQTPDGRAWLADANKHWAEVEAGVKRLVSGELLR